MDLFQCDRMNPYQNDQVSSLNLDPDPAILLIYIAMAMSNAING